MEKTNNSTPKLPPIPDEIKAKFEELKNKLEKFKKEILSKFDKYIMGLSLMPPLKDSKDKKEINVFILVDDSDSKDVAKFDLKDRLIKVIEKIAKEVDPNIKPEVMLNTELIESCYDAKYEVLRDIGESTIFYDPSDMLAALKISELHKSMTIKKFEKYIVSYVAAGSLFRGEKSNDIDVYIVVDDTDVKKMSRFELKDKLRAIIISMGLQAKQITGVQKDFHIQVYILTDFWESVKDASPVIFTFLRDGIPLYDRGVFMPWKLLLKMGRIRPSPEAIDLHMDVGEKSIEMARGRLINVVGQDLYYGILNPAQAALMLYGVAPPNPRETIKLLDEIFVKKEKLLEKKYVDILNKIFLFYKDIEHGKIKDISGAEVDKLLRDADAYMKRIKKLFSQIEKKTESAIIEELYDTCIKVANDVLSLESIKGEPVKGLNALVKKGIMSERFLGILKEVMKAKRDYDAKKLSKQEIEKVRRLGSIFISAMTEYIQRKRGIELERARLRFKYGDKFGEMYLLDDDIYVIEDIDAKDKSVRKSKMDKDGRLSKFTASTIVELESEIVKRRIPKHVFIKEHIFEDLKSLFGKDVKISVNY
ncbi:MAG: hypothetical protein AABX29_09575 [Nanoarchaeota archaeon]